MAERKLTASEILDLSSLDVSRMTEKQLREAVQTLADVANKRLKRLETTPFGTAFPAYKTAMKRGRFSTKGKNQGQLQSEFKRARAFLTSQTSRVSTVKRLRKEAAERVGGGFTSEASESAYWAAYRAIEAEQPALVLSYGSTQVQRYLREEWESSTPLTEGEIYEYESLFPDDTQDLTSLSQQETAAVRTLLEIGGYYEFTEAEGYAGLSSFFTSDGEDI